MAHQPPFYKRLQRKFPQPEPTPTHVEESPEPPEEVPEPTVDEAMAAWAAEVEAEGELEKALEFDDPNTETIEWSESQLKADLFDLATKVLEIEEIDENSLKRDIVEALRNSDKATEV